MIVLIIIFVCAVIIAPYWIIWQRSGHSGLWSLFLLLPGTNICVPYILAFKSWPSEAEQNDQDVFR